MGLLGEALSRPTVRRALWRAWYPFFSRRIAGRGVDFLNYAYDSLDGTRPVLDACDEPVRHHVQLYAHVVGDAELHGRRVLEVSCGHGGGASWVVRAFGPAAYVGLDLNPEALRHCLSRHRLPGLTFVQGDAQALPFEDASFDVVLNVEASHCYPDFPGFVAEVTRVLRPGGVFLHADLRHASGIPEWVGALAGRQGLRLEVMRLITPEVLRGMEAISTRHEALVRECMPWPLRGLGRDFAGVRGSLPHRALSSGQLDYRSFRLARL
ncbi:MAG: phthiotriol/phenolphthiotriol dimycocerosates methyltransferase [Opitutales bacterium]